MEKLFVDQTISINAPVEKVWQVLTDTQLTTKWAKEFTGGHPFHLDSDWQLGSEVNWKDDQGVARVTGKVTAVDPSKLLRFTVMDIAHPVENLTEEDGITYIFTETDGTTTLNVRQGDFGIMEDGQKYRDMSDQIWQRVLTTVKDLAENQE